MQKGTENDKELWNELRQVQQEIADFEGGVSELSPLLARLNNAKRALGLPLDD